MIEVEGLVAQMFAGGMRSRQTGRSPSQNVQQQLRCNIHVRHDSHQSLQCDRLQIRGYDVDILPFVFTNDHYMLEIGALKLCQVLVSAHQFAHSGV